MTIDFPMTPELEKAFAQNRIAKATRDVMEASKALKEAQAAYVMAINAFEDAIG